MSKVKKSVWIPGKFDKILLELTGIIEQPFQPLGVDSKEFENIFTCVLKWSSTLTNVNKFR